MKQLSREILAVGQRLVGQVATHLSGMRVVQSGRSAKESLCPSRKVLPTGVGIFRQLVIDHCMYAYQGTGGEKIILAHYVDDIICATH